MDNLANTLETRVARELREYQYYYPKEAIGDRWAPEKVERELALVESMLVKPRKQRVRLQDTYEQIQSSQHSFADYWVVAEDECYLVCFDPQENEFALAEKVGPEYPVTIGVRGDFVGTALAR